MLDICYRFGVNNSIVFNQRKSICTSVVRNQPNSGDEFTTYFKSVVTPISINVDDKLI